MKRVNIVSVFFTNCYVTFKRLNILSGTESVLVRIQKSRKVKIEALQGNRTIYFQSKKIFAMMNGLSFSFFNVHI